MPELTLSDLIANRTLSAEMAALLAAGAEERRSLLMVAIPRMAGKSTVMEAVLAHRAPGVPRHDLGTRHGSGLGLPEAGSIPGYLAWSEIARHPVTDAYLWGAPVRRIFEVALAGGHSIATALHADGVASAFEVIRENGVDDKQAALIDLVAYIRSIGQWDNPDRRAIEALYEIDRVEDGVPAARLIHRWDEASDRFEVVGEPVLVSSEAAARHLERFAPST